MTEKSIKQMHELQSMVNDRGAVVLEFYDE